MKAEARKQVQSDLPEEPVLPKLTYAEAPEEFGPHFPVKVLRLSNYIDGNGISALKGLKCMEENAPTNQVRYLIDFFPRIKQWRVVHFASGHTTGKTTYTDGQNSWDWAE